jgi:hypothetical protein
MLTIEGDCDVANILRLATTVYNMHEILCLMWTNFTLRVLSIIVISNELMSVSIRTYKVLLKTLVESIPVSDACPCVHGLPAYCIVLFVLSMI